MISNSYQNWQLDLDDKNIFWLTLDRKDKSVNSVNMSVLAELESILRDIKKQPSAIGVIIQSGKSSGFIAGADIESFKDVQTPEAALEFIQYGQKVLQQLSALAIPSVALIDGFCLGGGLELALACRYRVANADPKTKLGLPEVKLGIQPGWGGTIRLPKLVRIDHALNWMIQGKLIVAKVAKRAGLVDAAVPERQLKRAAVHFITKKPAARKMPFINKLFNFKFARYPVAQLFYWLLNKKISRDHYPAPFAIIENWQRNGIEGTEVFKREAESIGRLCMTDTAKNLIRVFFLQEQLKSLPGKHRFTGRSVHVIGAGTMGGDIAAWCSLRGLRVTLQDKDPRVIAQAIQRANKLFVKKLKEPRLIQAALDRLIPDMDGFGIPHADVIIEAIFENLEVKNKLFKELEGKAKPEAILATNTSSIPLDKINVGMVHPERLVGIHFFNPVAMLQLVEIVYGNSTDQNVINQAAAFVKAIDRLPLPVKSTPGFLVNRILMPYLLECVTLLDEGVPGELIDEAAVKFGMPMGPVELADVVGLDVCFSVASFLTQEFGGQIPSRLKQLVDKGFLGKKSGKGFYEYKNGKVKKPVLTQATRDAHHINDITDRLILRLENEAVACLREKVVAHADLLDAGMIFGTGFAPFRGGPIHYARTRGILQVTEQLQRLQSQHGSRFAVDEKWGSL